MIPAHCRLAALIAVFAPDRAQRLTALLSATSDGIAERTATLARCTREERLAALAAAFSSAKTAGVSRLGRGHPLWQRLAGEARARGARSEASAPRTGVLREDGSPCPHREITPGDEASAGGTLHETTRRR